MEEKYVHNVYDSISDNFNNTRAYVWKSIKNFILQLKENSLILDCGCGNGKNMEINKKCYFIGFDYSINLLKICKNKNLNILQSNIKKIPFKDEIFDATISVAVLHHIYFKSDRSDAINELIRVTKKNGEILIQVWSNDVKKNKKFTKINNNNDYFVSWYVNKNLSLNRYYHLFTNKELIDLIPNDKVYIKDIYDEMENIVLILVKK